MKTFAKAHEGDNGLVFLNQRGKKWNSADSASAILNKWLKLGCKEMGLPHTGADAMRVHDLRHTYAYLVAATVQTSQTYNIFWVTKTSVRQCVTEALSKAEQRISQAIYGCDGQYAVTLDLEKRLNNLNYLFFSEQKTFPYIGYTPHDGAFCA